MTNNIITFTKALVKDFEKTSDVETFLNKNRNQFNLVSAKDLVHEIQICFLRLKTQHEFNNVDKDSFFDALDLWVCIDTYKGYTNDLVEHYKKTLEVKNYLTLDEENYIGKSKIELVYIVKICFNTLLHENKIQDIDQSNFFEELDAWCRDEYLKITRNLIRVVRQKLNVSFVLNPIFEIYKIPKEEILRNIMDCFDFMVVRREISIDRNFIERDTFFSALNQWAQLRHVNFASAWHALDRLTDLVSDATTVYK